MKRRYIDGQEARITQNDGIFVDVEFFHGEKITMLEPLRLFPISGLTRYITLLDEKGNEQAVIRNIDNLMPESKQVIENCLHEYYMIPKITRLIERDEKYSIWMWTVDTDRGKYTFEIRHSITAIKPLYDGRVLIKDANDNRYEITNINDLDPRSRKLILPEL